MAGTAHKSEEEMMEHYDSPEVLESKIQQLADLIRKSNHMVAFTGAGISTSAGIHDFRGPTGKWTREAKGLKPLKGTSTLKAFPTTTHMSLVKLQQEGILKYLISQNCDGLHVRSGFDQGKLSELHGNGNMAICESCGQKYFYDKKVGRYDGPNKIRRDRWSGEHCLHSDCVGRQLATTICFGQELPPKPLALAEENSEKADLHLALGSSLTVTPAADCPRTTAFKRDGNLVIINLQNTPLTNIAKFQIYAKTDEVMARVMEKLQLQVPSFCLRRKVMCGVDPSGKGFYLRGADWDDLTLEHRFIHAVTWSDPQLRDGQGFDHAGQEINSEIPSNKFSGINMMASSVKNFGESRVFVDVKLGFASHYEEPDLILSNDFTEAYRSQQRIEYLWTLEFDPYEKTWSTSVELSTIPEKSDRVKDNSFGKLCKKYTLGPFLEKKGYSKSQANKMWKSYVRRHQKKE